MHRNSINYTHLEQKYVPTYLIVFIYVISSFQVMESPSDSVNGVNADVPSDNDVGQNVVRALLAVDDSGPIEKRQNQMANAKSIIIPFPFGLWLEGRRRKKRDAQRRMNFFARATGVALVFTSVFSTSINILKQNQGLNDNISRGSHNGLNALITLDAFSTFAALVLLVFAIYYYFKIVGFTMCGLIIPEAGPGQRQVEIP